MQTSSATGAKARSFWARVWKDRSFAREYKGAMPEYLLREGDENLLRAYQNKYPGVIRYITVSPEVPDVVEMIGKIQPRRGGCHRSFRRGL